MSHLDVGGERLRVDGKVVVLGRDLDSPEGLWRIGWLPPWWPNLSLKVELLERVFFCVVVVKGKKEVELFLFFAFVERKKKTEFEKEKKLPTFSLPSQRLPQHLVPHADPKHRLLAQQLLGRCHGIGHGRGVPWAV